MKNIKMFCVGVVFLIVGNNALFALEGKAFKTKPNIILFIVDDMGWQDTSVPMQKKRTVWNDLYFTPNMELLAKKGMRFSQAYASHPVCSPTRVSLMTGKNPARSRVDDWVGHGDAVNQYLSSGNWAKEGLQPGDGNLTLPTILRRAGYRTIHIGKAHFGAKEGGNPCNLGFDINIGGSHGGGPWGGWYSPWLGKFQDMYPNLEKHPKGEYLTDAITEEAERLITQAVKDHVPFFLNMAQYAVHTQIAAAPEKYLSHYKDGRPKVERDYGSMITAMDASLGRILARLEDPNGDGDTSDSIATNTFIYLISDNGGLSNHTRSNAGEVELTDGRKVLFKRDRHNWPARSGKGSGYEGGIRIPMIVAWAGQKSNQPPINFQIKIVPNSLCEQPVHTDDVFPTILALAGVKNPVDSNLLDGENLLGLFNGKPFKRQKALYWHYPHQWYRDIGVGEGIEPFSAVRIGEWKLIYFYGDGVNDGVGYDPRTELYNLKDDMSESHNLATKYPERARTMRRQLFSWLKKINAELPIVRATKKTINIPTDQTPFN